jgi:CPA2 family monovalent cation:H+ antiporter-2
VAMLAQGLFCHLRRINVFIIVSLIVGILTIPRLLNYIDNFRSNEMLLISVLGLLFGFCLLVIKLEYSMALGAFLIGAIIAESRQVEKIEHLIEPVRDMFSAIFLWRLVYYLIPVCWLIMPYPF